MACFVLTQTMPDLPWSEDVIVCQQRWSRWLKDTSLVEAHLLSVDTSVCALDGDVFDLSNVKPRAKEFVFRICFNKCVDLFWLDLVERKGRR